MIKSLTTKSLPESDLFLMSGMNINDNDFGLGVPGKGRPREMGKGKKKDEDLSWLGIILVDLILNLSS
jgi:hypothetical protein